MAASVMTPMMRRMVNSKLALDGNKHDGSYEEVQEFEYKAWHDDPKKDWDSYTVNRPWSTKGYVSMAPKMGDAAPDGPVLSLEADGAPSTLLAEVKKMSATSGKEFVAVSFGTVSCPVWRTFGGQDLCRPAKDAGVPILHVYTMEAHAEGQFDAGPNMKGPIALTRQIPPHKDEAERRKAAMEGHAVISRELGEKQVMVLDGMDDQLEKAYEARPFRVYVIEAKSGIVAHATSLTPFNMPAKVEGLKAFFAANK